MGPSADQPHAGGATWSLRALCAGFGLAAAATSCSAYDEIPPPSQQRPQFEAVSDGGQGDAGTSAASDATDSARIDSASCESGECWWSHMLGDCRSAGMPTPNDRPNPAPDATDEAEVGNIYLGFTQIRLGATMGSMLPGSTPGQNIGLDLDGVCTSSTNCASPTTGSCRSQVQKMPDDGDACRDNAFARVLAIVSGLPLLGERFGLSEELFNCGLWRGTYNMIARIKGYNGKPNDDRVRVDWYTSSGLERAQNWTCPSENFNQHYPIWRASAPWAVLDSELSGPISTPGSLPDSLHADSDAYVREGYLVSRMPDGAVLRLAGDAKPYRGFALTTHEALYLGRLARTQDTTWRISDGVVAGRTRPDEVIRGFRQTGFCVGMGLDPVYENFVSYAEQNSDVLAGGQNAADEACDALSFGIGFDAAQITPGGVAQAEPLVECCAPGMTADGCQDACGNGTVSGMEQCDTAIPEGQSGACPKRCLAPQQSCERVALQGSGCMAQCATTKITAAEDNDGCCPDGFNAQQDRDCPAQCGNGVREPDESCDPASDCPPCNSNNACMLAVSAGTECRATCQYSLVTACKNADGCCPAGCTRTLDDDCSTSCGNRLVERGETCEAGTSSPCPTSCADGNDCTEDLTTGSAANCNVRCEHPPIIAIKDGDGCCPGGADAEHDSDCKPVCGNGRVEANEQCDDGNRMAGDGCNATCQLEGALGTCVNDLKRTDKCALCACGKCQPQVEACYGGPSPDEVKLCGDLVNCVLDEACDATTCYCGTADLFRCTYGSPNGPCRREVEGAARSTGVSAIMFRANDVSYPIGRANALNDCVFNQCGEACALR